MRKLLNTLFVISEDSYMILDGENVVIMSGKDILARFPLHTLENILYYSNFIFHFLSSHVSNTSSKARIANDG